MKDRSKVESVRLPVIDSPPHVENFGVSDGFIEASETEFGEILTYFLGDEFEEVDDEFGRSLEPLAQNGVLRCDAHRAGVQMTHAHHHAPHDHQRCRREPVLLSSQKRSDHNVASGFELSVSLDDNTIAKAVEQQGLLRFRQTQLPGRTRVLERCQR